MGISQVFNSVEMVFWLTVGAIFFASGFYSRNRYKKLSFLLSVAFVAFGLSDGAEFHTGAWWQLVWKALCIVVFVVALLYYLWHEHRLNKNT